MKMKVYHTQIYNDQKLIFPKFAEGFDNWLGDGFYFWQDYEFAEWWGDEKKCYYENHSKKYDIYIAELELKDDDFIDTVFNEEDYYNFVRKIEKFAKKFQKKVGRKPTIEEFNLFISKFNIWNSIKAIRFQDLPKNNYFLEVKGFFYKKRIQIRVNNPKIISNFAHYKTKDCV